MTRRPRPSPPSASPRLLLLALLVAHLAAVSTPATARAQHTLDDWMTVSGVRELAWAPSGEHLYYTSNAAPTGTWEVYRIGRDGSDPTLLTRTPEGERPEPKTGLLVSADGRRLVFTSARYFQAYDNIFTLPSTGGVPEAVTFNDGVVETGPDLAPDGRTLAWFARVGERNKIFLKDLATPGAWPRLLLPGEGQETHPSFSPDGTSVAFSRGGDIWVVPAAGGEPRLVVAPEHQGGNGSPAWSPDGRRMAFTNGRSGYSQVAVVDVATGAVTPITHAPAEHGDVAWSPDGRTLAFVRNSGAGTSRELVVAPAGGGGPARVLSRGAGLRSSPAFSPDGRELAFIEETSTRTEDVWVVAVSGGAPRQLTRSMGRVDPSRLSVAEDVTYPGPDFLQIPAMLLKPRGFDPSRRYPVIVRLHGHPGQWNHGFDPMDQYFLERGFVLLKPNPRGSRGFGQGFHDLHIADYGGIEKDDVLAALPYLESLGFVDMTRKATWGGSGGGYMSFVLATEAPDAFQAQVIRAPVSDWQLLAIDRYGASGRAWTATRTPRRERSEFGGAYEEIPEEYERRSPVNFVESVRVPQLLFQGLRDGSVPPRQSLVWVDAMREAGKGNLLTYVEYPTEDHGLRRYKTTVRDRLERMTEFLARHLDLPRLGR